MSTHAYLWLIDGWNDRAIAQRCMNKDDKLRFQTT